MDLSDQQLEAVDHAFDFITDPKDTRKFFTLGGLAGTGKTTVLAELCRRLNEDSGIGYVVGTPTGKAASVLRKKDVPAATIHKLCYLCAGTDKHGKLMFDFVGIEDSDGVGALLIDEASMVDKRILRDLQSAGLKLVFVGDYGQLPPVMDDPGLMQNLDFTLTENFRQKDHLLQIAFAVREARAKMGLFFERPEIARYARLGTADAWPWANEGDIVLVGKNVTRHAYNSQRLRELGLDVTLSELEKGRVALGEQLVELAKPFPVCVMSNCYPEDLMNGELGWFIARESYGELITGEWFDGEPAEGEIGRTVIVNPASLFTNPGVVPFHADGLKLDFGWAITVHKAQGSEWPHVVVMDQGFGTTDDVYRRWRYTAATRARTRLTWLGNKAVRR